jgi:hypothetical protein
MYRTDEKKSSTPTVWNVVGAERTSRSGGTLFYGSRDKFHGTVSRDKFGGTRPPDLHNQHFFARKLAALLCCCGGLLQISASLSVPPNLSPLKKCPKKLVPRPLKTRSGLPDSRKQNPLMTKLVLKRQQCMETFSGGCGGQVWWYTFRGRRRSFWGWFYITMEFIQRALTWWLEVSCKLPQGFVVGKQNRTQQFTSCPWGSNQKKVQLLYTEWPP